MGNPDRPLLILGCGYVGQEVARLAVAAGRTVLATTRRVERAAELATQGVTALNLTEVPLGALADGDLVVTYPPDVDSDVAFAKLVGASQRVAYLSSTAVYGDRSGRIDLATSVDDSAETGPAWRRLAAERTWQSVGASVLRAPGIYGPGRGVHKRLQAGTFRFTGDGSNYFSRIHVTDLARCCLAALECPPTVHLTADARPCTQRELVEFLCNRLVLPLPEAVPPDRVHHTLRRSRQVDARASLATLELSLVYPCYREGYAAIL